MCRNTDLMFILRKSANYKTSSATLVLLCTFNNLGVSELGMLLRLYKKLSIFFSGFMNIIIGLNSDLHGVCDSVPRVT